MFLLAIVRLIKENMATWAEYAFVVATAISFPASVYKTMSDSLAIELSFTFIIPKVSILFSLASFKDARVSAVSPDCDTTITNSFSLY